MQESDTLSEHESDVKESICTGSGGDLSIECLGDGIISDAWCSCGVEDKAHKDCPMNSQNRFPGCSLFSCNVKRSPVLSGNSEPPTNLASFNPLSLPIGERPRWGLGTMSTSPVAHWVQATLLVAS